MMRRHAFALLLALPATAFAQEATPADAQPADAQPADEPAPAAEAPAAETPAAETPPKEQPRFRIGIGAAVDLATFEIFRDTSVSNTLGTQFTGSEVNISPGGFTALQVPIWIDDLRIEPEIGYYRASQEADFDRGDFGGQKTTVVASGLRLGAGVAWAFEVAERTWAYVGPRFGVVLRDESQEMEVEGESQEVTLSSTDLWIGLGLGGEAFLTPGFSVGVEGQLNYYSLGDPRVSVAPAEGIDLDPGDLSRSIINTNALIFGRVYLR